MALFRGCDEEADKIKIDLNGAEGNVFSLMGIAKRISKQTGENPLVVGECISMMKESDYKNAVMTFESFYGNYCEIYNADCVLGRD